MNQCWLVNGPLARYLKLWDAHAPGMLGTFSPLLRVSDPDMHHGTCVTHVPRCMPGSLTSCFLWNLWWGKRSQHSRRMRNPQFCVSGKRPIARFCDIHLRATSQLVPKLQFRIMSLEIIFSKLLSQVPRGQCYLACMQHITGNKLLFKTTVFQFDDEYIGHWDEKYDTPFN